MKRNVLNISRLEDAAGRLRAIAHPMRIAIIDMLNDNVTMNVTEIYQALSIEQASASHHLTVLKSKGVLGSRREGKNTYYFLKHAAVSQIIECLEKCELHK
jgi:DNA-binding transcriptional ArsR family regulator